MSTRRDLLLGVGCLLLLRTADAAAPSALFQPAIDAFTGGRTPRDGRVRLAIDTLVENGNVVPVSVSVDSPMTVAEHVQRIALFTENNPQPEVAVFHLGPRNGRATVATRMRLATSQHVIALAQLSDGSVWRHSVEVVVTLAACLEGEGG
jgi:sulfur-oxidizing protein SoxY